MNFKKCICGGILFAIGLSIYQCNRCGQHCEHAPHIPETNYTNFNQSGINIAISSGITTADPMDDYYSLES